MARTVRLRQLAAADLDDASVRYRCEAGDQTALDFIDAIERAINEIGRRPHMGSLQFAYELGIPDLRAWPLRRFPYVVFYVAAEQEIDVWRVLHSRRDVPTTLASPQSSR